MKQKGTAVGPAFLYCIRTNSAHTGSAVWLPTRTLGKGEGEALGRVSAALSFIGRHIEEEEAEDIP